MTGSIRSGRAARLLAVAIAAAAVVLAVSCSSGGSTSTTDTSAPTDTEVDQSETTAAPALDASSDGLEGTYRLTSTLVCGLDQVDLTEEEMLTVKDGQASVTFQPSGMFEGPIVSTADSFSFDVTQPDQYTTLHLEGSITDEGDTLSGTGRHGQGTQMSNCEVRFTGVRTMRGVSGGSTTTTGPTTDPGCDLATLQAVVLAAHPGAEVNDQAVCIRDWALLNWWMPDDPEEQAESRDVLRFTDGAWHVVPEPVCESVELEADVYEKACQTG